MDVPALCESSYFSAIWSLHKIGDSLRDYEEMIRQLDIITHEKRAFIVVLNLPILDSRNKYGDDLTYCGGESQGREVWTYIPR